MLPSYRLVNKGGSEERRKQKRYRRKCAKLPFKEGNPYTARVSTGDRMVGRTMGWLRKQIPTIGRIDFLGTKHSFQFNSIPGGRAQRVSGFRHR